MKAATQSWRFDPLIEIGLGVFGHFGSRNYKVNKICLLVRFRDSSKNPKKAFTKSIGGFHPDRTSLISWNERLNLNMNKFRSCFVATKNICIWTVTHSNDGHETTPTKFASNKELTGVTTMAFVG